MKEKNQFLNIFAKIFHLFYHFRTQNESSESQIVVHRRLRPRPRPFGTLLKRIETTTAESLRIRITELILQNFVI